MRHSCKLFAVVALGAALAVPATAQAAPVTVENLSIDSYEPNNDGYAGLVRTVDSLPSGALYIAEARGTVSFWKKRNWNKNNQEPIWNTVCGAPTPDVLFSSPDSGDGKAGVDPEFIFARPWTTSACGATALPARWNNFQVNVGNGWAHPIPAGGRPTAPSANHKYSYPLIGTGARARFRIEDKPRTNDNYGQFRVKIRRADAMDCAAGYKEFGFADAASCAAQVTPSA